MRKNLILLCAVLLMSLNAVASEADIKSGQCMATVAILIKKTDNDKIGSALQKYWTKNQAYMKNISAKVGNCIGGKQDDATAAACINQLPPNEKDFWKGFNAVIKEGGQNNFSPDYLYRIPLVYCGGVAG